MSLNSFNNKTTGYEVANAYGGDITGKNVLITGANPQGLGAAAARAIATAGPALIILTYRTKEKIDELLTELRETYPNVPFQALELHLELPDSIRRAAEELNASITHLDILINNAGVMSVQELILTPAGIESHFAINHLGHFLFTNLIMEKLIAGAKRSGPGKTRVINLAGDWHHFSQIRFDDLSFQGNPIPLEQQPDKDYLAKYGLATDNVYIPEVGYAQSKTANILFSVYLTQHLSKYGILSFSPNPGGVFTDIARYMPQTTIDHLLGMDVIDKNQEQGASTILTAAFDPNLTADSEPYLRNCQSVPPKDYAKDKEISKKLWHLSERLVKQDFPLIFV
ncbi:hypothetical protein LSUE1_G001927 [Lachnellula suecica]|uniref:Uncharacterized protein n=1 Tax=Lachnellula suecica TaxID=602035 RepID=A0A8T9CMP6_9HELO|nr:hypothetical protein LSUE1_G001927 [Lachnellula suecica]